ncbi:MAG: hypothetical protein BWY43_00662 [candidate division WS2 bacterium ADurb.Bin280]|uniref:Uncharacterized protein n=1 Tax=candidate division WS2 bacterium ADurb.Bin280 TaxID=1852829 RepID=A0A1V5SC39_9BACT|nr:MAG: hypothetical protein BWY43_00662 [candidate division WS2 bacterium ADurb.Bin280]
MNSVKKVFAIIVLLAFLGGGSYAVYLAINGTRENDIEPVANVSDEGVELLFGDLGTDLKYLTSPSTVDYGVVKYPSAVVSSQKELSFEGEVNGSQLTVGTFTTEDTVDKVMDFYIGKFGKDYKSGSINGQAGSTDYKYVTSEDEDAPVVIIYRSVDRTVIHLAKPGLSS